MPSEQFRHGKLQCDRRVCYDLVRRRRSLCNFLVLLNDPCVEIWPKLWDDESGGSDRHLLLWYDADDKRDIWLGPQPSLRNCLATVPVLGQLAQRGQSLALDKFYVGLCARALPRRHACGTLVTLPRVDY